MSITKLATMRAVFLLPLLLVLLSREVTARAPIGSSVRLFAALEDYTDLCDTVLANAARVSGTSAINFYPTQSYHDYQPDAIPDGFCISRGYSECEPATPEAITRFEAAMTHCFEKAYALGFRTFEITPRMDDAQQRVWRNDMRLDPFKDYGDGVTYKTILIDPLIRALNKLPETGVLIYFNLQGEMNGPVITAPAAWQRLGAHVRDSLKPPSKIGLNLNFNKVCGWCTGPNYAPSGYGAEVFDKAAIQALFDDVDFVGMSAYAPQLVNGDATSTPSKIQNSIWINAAELLNFGVDLKALNKAGKPIHYSEFGLGGGVCGNTNCPAANRQEVALHPYWGVSAAQYDQWTDPWKNGDNSAYRQEYFRSAIMFLNNAANNEFDVDMIFLWNHASYDVQGVFPGVSTPEGSWADQTIVGWIEAWNKRGAVPS